MNMIMLLKLGAQIILLTEVIQKLGLHGQPVSILAILTCIVRYNPIRSTQRASNLYYSKPISSSIERLNKYSYQHDNGFESFNKNKESPKHKSRHAYKSSNIDLNDEKYIFENEKRQNQVDYYIDNDIKTKHPYYERKRYEFSIERSEEDELNERIKALKDCIKEIENKQEELLRRIDTRIGTEKNLYEKETAQQAEADKFNQIYEKSIQKSQQIRDKYLDYSDKNQYAIQPSPKSIRKEKERLLQSDEKSDTDDIKQNEKFDDNVRETIKSRSTFNDFNDRVKQQEHEYTYPKLNVEYQPRSKFQHTQMNNFSSYDNYISLNSKSNQDDETFKVVDVKSTSTVKNTSNDPIQKQILERNSSVLRSRSSRYSPSRSSPRLQSRASTESIPKNYSKDYFINKTKQEESNVMIDDSFGSPEPKKRKAKMNMDIKEKVTYTMEDLPNFQGNNHIIKNLETQQKAFAKFIPESRVEPVPTNLVNNEFSIAYKSSPEIVSYNYEKSGSPPSLKKSRKKLYFSPTSKRQK